MKLITEFSVFNLNKALAHKSGLAAEGKSPEEIQENLATTYKLEGDKLKFFVNALDVASQNQTALKRVFVATLTEGENQPAKAVQIEDHFYVPEFITAPKPVASVGKGGPKGGGRGGPGGKGGEKVKTSPWGMSPEEIAAKKGRAKPS